MIHPTKYYVFYDGDCGFCNHWVQWILKNDYQNLFLFASLQSDFGQKFLQERGLNHKEFNTIYLWKPEHYYFIKSQAITQIAKLLGGKYRLLASLNIFPSFFTNPFYDLIANHRKKLMASQCFLPTKEEQKKFVS